MGRLETGHDFKSNLLHVWDYLPLWSKETNCNSANDLSAVVMGTFIKGRAALLWLFPLLMIAMRSLEKKFRRAVLIAAKASQSTSAITVSLTFGDDC